jgi:NAD(P)-dependent dehydrogenase (short-subunit alcohol dehydrogenase family)
LVSGHLGDEDILASSVSLGLEGLIRSIAREGARRGVVANALVVGQIEGWDEATSQISRPLYEVYFPFRQPFRVGDLAQAIVELTTSPGGKINGQIVGFDGGTIL